MKKVVILLIALMVISVGLLSGCTTSTKTCTACDGTGKCNRCYGTGWAIDGDLQCNNCHGTGDCPVCHGTGQISEGMPGFEATYLIIAIGLICGALLFNKKRKRYE